jgi:hypothetical protein
MRNGIAVSMDNTIIEGDFDVNATMTFSGSS